MPTQLSIFVSSTLWDQGSGIGQFAGDTRDYKCRSGGGVGSGEDRGGCVGCLHIHSPALCHKLNTNYL